MINTNINIIVDGWRPVTALPTKSSQAERGMDMDDIVLAHLDGFIPRT